MDGKKQFMGEMKRVEYWLQMKLSAGHHWDSHYGDKATLLKLAKKFNKEKLECRVIERTIVDRVIK